MEIRFSVEYIDLITHVKSLETVSAKELKFFFQDEVNNEIFITEIDYSTDNWETMSVLFKLV